MKVKSVSDCLHIFDDAIVEKIIDLSDLENIHQYLLEKGRSDFIENRVALANVLSQINSIMEKYFKFDEEDIKSEYEQLREVI